MDSYPPPVFPPSYRTPTQEVCPECHQPVLPQYYFCPNCGHSLHEPPLSTSIATQAWIYAFSIILPIMCFLLVSKWPGPKYYRSQDPKTKMIGTVAWTFLILSTLVTLWYAYVWTEDAIQSTTSQINAEMSI